MPFRFTAARTPAHSPIVRALTRRPASLAANDNCTEGDDRLLHAALRHFGEHGLRAAHEARKQAERAFFSGDRSAYDWWFAICRTLDRRLASGLERATATAAPDSAATATRGLTEGG